MKREGFIIRDGPVGNMCDLCLSGNGSIPLTHSRLDDCWTTILYCHSHHHRFDHQPLAKATKRVGLDKLNDKLDGSSNHPAKKAPRMFWYNGK